jgi:glutamate-1-semialdehyde 2,1-aminomutase
LSDAIRLFLLNRGMLVTPFHVMMLTCPATTAAQVDGLLAGWAAAVDALRG